MPPSITVSLNNGIGRSKSRRLNPSPLLIFALFLPAFEAPLRPDGEGGLLSFCAAGLPLHPVSLGPSAGRVWPVSGRMHLCSPLFVKVYNRKPPVSPKNPDNLIILYITVK